MHKCVLRGHYREKMFISTEMRAQPPYSWRQGLDWPMYATFWCADENICAQERRKTFRHWSIHTIWSVILLSTGKFSNSAGSNVLKNIDIRFRTKLLTVMLFHQMPNGRENQRVTFSSAWKFIIWICYHLYQRHSLLATLYRVLFLLMYFFKAVTKIISWKLFFNIIWTEISLNSSDFY